MDVGTSDGVTKKETVMNYLKGMTLDPEAGKKANSSLQSLMSDANMQEHERVNLFKFLPNDDIQFEKDPKAHHINIPEEMLNESEVMESSEKGWKLGVVCNNAAKLSRSNISVLAKDW